MSIRPTPSSEPSVNRRLRNRRLARVTLVLLGGIGLFAALALTQNRRLAGPEVDGRPLIRWIRLAGNPDHLERGRAITVIQTNLAETVSLLRIELRRRPSPWSRMRSWLRRNVPYASEFIARSPQRLWQDQATAATAAGTLGTNAVAVLPELIGALGRAPDYGIATAARMALSQLGPVALPSVVEVLEKGGTRQRIAAAECLRDMGRAAAPALPALREALGDRELQVKMAAAWALEQIGPGVETVLAKGLSDPDPAMRREILLILSRRLEWPRVGEIDLSAVRADGDPSVRMLAQGLALKLREGKIQPVSTNTNQPLRLQ